MKRRDAKRFERTYGQAFTLFLQNGLNPYEEMVDAVPAISEEVAAIDFDDREGTLGVSNQRLVFVAIKSGNLWVRYGFLHVENATLENASFGQKFLNLSLAGGHTSRFMVGSSQGERLLPSIARGMHFAREMDKRIKERESKQ